VQLPPVRWEPTPRRIRVRLGGSLVADSSRAILLLEYGPGRLPTYYFPRDDVRPDALVDESRGADGRRAWTVMAGQSRLDAAAWEHPAATGDLAALADHVTFSWQRLEWFEEDERVVVHARDPYKRVDTLRSSRRVEVFVAGERVASTIRPLLLFETHLPTRFYLPPDDVWTELFEPSDLVTSCPYKGAARYWSVRVGETLEPDLVWSYPDPIAENPKIKDLICFFNERVDVVVDGVALDRPVTPWSQP
jgi:uncharacterized protein (DUF427 family)